jgi:hypothetical protein
MRAPRPRPRLWMVVGLVVWLLTIGSASGSLVFSGGISDARGHEGDNPGRTALMAILTGGHPAAIRTPVFGCYLYAESDVKASGTIDAERQ